jgi:hypothetical protein
MARPGCIRVKHVSSFRRVLAVIKDEDQLKSLDPRNPGSRRGFETASGENDLRKIFTELGGNY